MVLWLKCHVKIIHLAKGRLIFSSIQLLYKLFLCCSLSSKFYSWGNVLHENHKNIGIVAVIYSNISL